MNSKKIAPKTCRMNYFLQRLKIACFLKEGINKDLYCEQGSLENSNGSSSDGRVGGIIVRDSIRW
jgi:hypothetical protein